MRGSPQKHGRISLRRSLDLGPRLPAVVLAISWAAAASADAGPTQAASVAVAENFRDCLQDLAAAFTNATGHRITVSSGSTGQIFAQIRNGAPYALFFAADRESPAALEELGLTVPGTRFTYAVGRLALVTAQDRYRAAADPCSLLAAGDYRHLAVANPELAPYGRAAVEALESLGLWPEVRDRLVYGQSVGQVRQFTASGNADLGLLSWAQTCGPDRASLAAWVIPEQLHEPIVQQAVLMRHAANDSAALAFLAFVRDPEGEAIIRRHGYATPTAAQQDVGDASP